MSARTLLILGALAALAVLGVWLTRDEPADAVVAAGDPFLPGLIDNINDIGNLTVRRAGGEVVAELERDEDGNWSVVSRWGYPADMAAVRATLVGLAEARMAEPRTANPDGWPRLGVGDIEAENAAGMEVRFGHGNTTTRAIIGHRGPGGEGSYARTPEQQRAWLLDQYIPRRTRAAEWMDARLVDVPVEDVVSVVIEPRSGDPVRVDRDTRATPGFRLQDVPEGATLLTPTIARSIARVVTELDFVDVRPADAVDDLVPVARARFETRDGPVIHIETLRLPAEDGLELARLRAEADADASAEVAEHADSLNERWSGWVYILPEHKYTNASHNFDRVVEPRRDAE